MTTVPTLSEIILPPKHNHSLFNILIYYVIDTHERKLNLHIF